MALNDRYSAILDKCVGSLITWRNFINENCKDVDEDPEIQSEIAKLKEIAKEYCIIDENHKRSENAIRIVEQSLTDPSQSYNIDAIYEEKLSEQTVRDPTLNEIWEQLFDHNASVQEVKPKKKKESSQYEQVDDSLYCASSFTAPVDPISKTVICKPVRNTKCKHVYDSQSIYDYIRQSKSKAKCPYMGCKNNKLIATDLKPDDQLEEKISQYLESQQNEETSESDSDD